MKRKRTKKIIKDLTAEVERLNIKVRTMESFQKTKYNDLWDLYEDLNDEMNQLTEDVYTHNKIREDREKLKDAREIVQTMEDLHIRGMIAAPLNHKESVAFMNTLLDKLKDVLA